MSYEDPGLDQDSIVNLIKELDQSFERKMEQISSNLWKVTYRLEDTVSQKLELIIFGNEIFGLEFLFVKTLVNVREPNEIIIYRDNELQIISDESEFANVKQVGKNKIKYDLYAILGEKVEWIKDKEIRRSIDQYLYETGAEIYYDTDKLHLDLSDYTTSPWLINYFRRNEFIDSGIRKLKQIHKPMFVDFELDVI